MSPEDRPAPVTIPTPEGYIGKSVVRRETARLQAGRGVFTDDLKLPRMTHVAFFRSPHAHARPRRSSTPSWAITSPSRWS